MMVELVFNIHKHLFDIHLYSLKAYNDFRSSKVYKWLKRLGLYKEGYHSPIGLYLWLSSPKDFDKEYLTDNLRHLSKVCELHLFQKVKSYSRIGTLLGILVTHEDYYYILMDEYGNKWYITCCSRIEFIKD